MADKFDVAGFNKNFIERAAQKPAIATAVVHPLQPGCASWRRRSGP